jgi:hypothetical protein
LKAGDRIKVIKGIVERLSKSDQEHIGLVLGQFGLGEPSWPGHLTKRQVVTLLVKDGTDEALEDLLAFLRSEEGPEAAVDPGEKIWKGESFRLFLSHISAHKQFVSRVKLALIPYGVSAFVAHEDIEPTEEWVKVIEASLASCHALAAFLTKDFRNSKWCDQEVGYCFRRKIQILPIRLGEDPHGFLAQFQGLPGSKNPKTVAEQIFAVLAKKPETASAMAWALTAKFAESNTYNEARDNFDLLEQVETKWPKELLNRIKRAAKENSQISDHFTVPARLKQFLEDRSS